MDRLLDQAHCGPAFLKWPAIAEIVKDSIEYGVKLGNYQLHAWVIMPNHVHLLLTPQIDLSVVMRSLKGFTARQANALLSRTGQPFWQRESYDHLVRNAEAARRIQTYIERNPVKAGLAPQPDQYQWSSAANRSSPVG